jgi:hypothetical protein
MRHYHHFLNYCHECYNRIPKEEQLSLAWAWKVHGLDRHCYECGKILPRGSMIIRFNQGAIKPEYLLKTKVLKDKGKDNYHARYTKQYMYSHPEIMAARRKIVNLKYIHKFVASELCEVCPEGEVQKATENHHPDYNYPEIVVACCHTCHSYLNKQRTQKNDESCFLTQVGASAQR